MRAAANIALLLAAAQAAAAPGGAAEVISARADAVSVTIYRDLFALVTESRTVDLPAGPVTLVFEGVPETLLPASTVVSNTGRPLVERNHDFDALTPNSLFEKSIGRQVLLTRTLPGSGKIAQVPATILAANPGGITLRTADGTEALHCSGLPEQVTFENVPSELHARPRLSVRLAEGAAGRREVRLSYLAHGFSWKSDYVARLDETGRKVDLRGWVTLQNLTGTRFQDARVQVVAGKLNLIDEAEHGTSLIGDTSDYSNDDSLRHAREEALDFLAAESLDSDPTLKLFGGCFSTEPLLGLRSSLMIAESLSRVAGYEIEEVIVTGLRGSLLANHENFADYHLYSVPFMTDLDARQTKQVLFLDKPGVKVERFYRQLVDVATYVRDEEEPEVPVLVLGFENRKSAGLGEPLPEGVLRLFESGSHGDIFHGEGSLHDTAVGVPVEIPLAGALGLALQIEVEEGDDFADAEIRIANGKNVPVTVEIRQEFDEYMTGARISRASHRTIRKSGDFAWRVRVSANSAETIRFRLKIPEEDDR